MVGTVSKWSTGLILQPTTQNIWYFIMEDNMKFDRFDFEQQLLDCWGVTKAINEVFEAVCDRNPALTEDELSNLLLGIKSLYELKFEKLWSQFESGIREKNIV
jgi:hypothetical protein